MSATIYKNEHGTFGVKFYSPKTKIQSHSKTFKLIEDAELKASEIETEFYSNNSEYLPKGITVNKSNWTFQLTIDRYVISNGKQKTLIGSSRRLKDIKEIRNNIIFQLV